jgi:hypothetical protein
MQNAVPSILHFSICIFQFAFLVEIQTSMRSLIPLLILLSCTSAASAAKPPIYVWFEPEWFDGVEGSFAYWTGTGKPTGTWGVAGPGISPEWTQGGESEWNSMGAPAEETKASCHRDFVVPRAGKYKVWVRYVDHRKKTQPFNVIIRQGDKSALTGELGVQPVVPVNDEYQLYWGFSFGWGNVAGDLNAGPARLLLTIDKPGQAWRQLDAVLITDDLEYVPVGREKPPFAYQSSFALQPRDGASWRGSAKDLPVGGDWKRSPAGGRDFTMWTGIGTDKKWWDAQKLDTLSLHDVFFQFSPPTDIRDKFHKQFAGRKDVPVMSWPGLRPGLYLGESPDLSPGTPLRSWLERTKTPFYIMTNYANPTYTDKTGPATYQALTGPLAEQFLGYIHGEALGTLGVDGLDKPLAPNRREHIDALSKLIVKQQAEAWSKFYKTPVPETHRAKSIPCLSSDSIALAHLFHEAGGKVVGYEEDATNVHIPMRIAFERGAARQYDGQWINYASGNFGDACNYFTQNPVVPRGAPSWFHSKYAVTDGVSVGWYRKMYYLNFLGGASAIYWEQSLTNQYMVPGPGTHPVELSPFGRATEDFMAFADRLPDRGEPYTPIAFLLSYGHGYERVNYRCKMLHSFREDKNDLELRELFNVAWHPADVVEGKPAAPDVQSMPNGVYGNIFDVLVDRPTRAKAIRDYPIVWAAGDVKLDGPWPAVLEDYVKRGGTLVVNIEAARALKFLGVKLTGKKSVSEQWGPEGSALQAATPFEVETVELDGATVLASAGPKLPLITRHAVGAGAVIVTLCPHMLGQDERAHPALPYLMNGVTTGLLPVEVRLANGPKLRGEVMYQVNRTKDGYLVALVNNHGVDKTQNGVARVDRRAFVDVVLRTKLPVKTAKEYTGPRDLTLEKDGDVSEVRLRVHPGDVQVVYLTTR